MTITNKGRNMKVAIYIANPEDFANGDYNYSLSATTTETWEFWMEDGINRHGYILLGHVDIDETAVSREESAQEAIKAIERRETEIRAKADAELTALDNRKANLLSLPAPEQL